MLFGKTAGIWKKYAAYPIVQGLRTACKRLLMNNRLKDLGGLNSVAELKNALRAICCDFGVVTTLEILVANQVGKRRALCFLRMATIEQEQIVMRELQLGNFGGDVIVIIELENELLPEPNAPKGHGVVKPGPAEFQPTLPIAALIKPSSFETPRKTGFSYSGSTPGGE